MFERFNIECLWILRLKQQVIGLSFNDGLFYRVLARGTKLLGLWTSALGPAAAGPAGSRKRIPSERVVLQVSDIATYIAHVMLRWSC